MTTEFVKAKGRTANEDIEQETLMQWAAYAMGTYPELNLLYHVPNGGKRNAAEAAHLKRQGVKAGVPDLCLPVPRGKYHGLYIELKAKNNQPTETQIDWLEALSAQGFKTAVCWGFEAARSVIESYMRLPHFENNEAARN